jgi:hypothetical protein
LFTLNPHWSLEAGNRLILAPLVLAKALGPVLLQRVG